MKSVAASRNSRSKEKHAYLLSLVALCLIALCLVASNWQYQRGIARHAHNALISLHVSQDVIELSEAKNHLEESEWRRTQADGTFDTNYQILLRNRYSEGKYGYDLLTLFHEKSGLNFWVDRGWIPPGANAGQAPILPATATAPISIIARIRLDHSLPQGSFFALSSSKNGELIPQWNAQSKSSVQTESFYLDLLSTSDPATNPAAPVELPEITDGPHMAYALQWLFFAGLIGYGRILLRRSR